MNENGYAAIALPVCVDPTDYFKRKATRVKDNELAADSQEATAAEALNPKELSLLMMRRGEVTAHR
jgi:hypothetical protein